MRPEYQEWINNWLSKNDPYGKCKDACQEMSIAFPELKMVRGHYWCPYWNTREHWWLIIGEEIIDPTVSQFPSNGVCAEYTPWDESQKEPTGICPNCGEYAYDSKTCCSEKCDREYAAYIMRGI